MKDEKSFTGVELHDRRRIEGFLKVKQQLEWDGCLRRADGKAEKRLKGQARSRQISITETMCHFTQFATDRPWLTVDYEAIIR